MKIKNTVKILICIILALTCLSGCTKADTVAYSDYLTLTATYPHSTDAFTQGLFFHNGEMFESVGGYGSSALFKSVVLKNGGHREEFRFDSSVFAEGSVVFENKLYLLTWEENKVFVLDPETLDFIDEISYPREGWGLTTDGKHLIASDGSSSLYFLDSQLNENKKLTVTMNGEERDNLNELEYIDGCIWANVWLTNEILVIDADSGNVVKSIDFSGLYDNPSSDIDDTMNGIAYNPETEKIYITGKRWNSLFEFETK